MKTEGFERRHLTTSVIVRGRVFKGANWKRIVDG